MQKNWILVLEEKDGLRKLELKDIFEDALGDIVNDESVEHILGVRVITEYLLRELSACKPELHLSEDDISSIAAASSVHDIGRWQDTYSHVRTSEKHSIMKTEKIRERVLLGEQIIRGAECGDIAPQTIKHAIQIVRYLHARIDGSGYPEGLSAEDIPLAAQVVALADSYESLTNPRFDEESYPKDIALQAIASGMCGTFDEVLVECLMRAVNRQELLLFRKKLQSKRSVVEDQSLHQAKRVLLIGNTEYVSEKFIADTFPRGRVMVVGNEKLGNLDKIKLFRIGPPSIKAILETYEFDLVIFFSAGLTFHSTAKSDAEELREVLQYIKELQKETKILYLSSLDTSFKEKTDRSIIAAANEELCDFYAKNHKMDIKTIQIPYLYSGTCKGDFLNRIFEAITKGKSVKIPRAPSALIHFLSMEDLSDLIVRIVDSWRSGPGVLTVDDEFHITFEQFAAELSTVDESVKIEFETNSSSERLKNISSVLRSEYGWFAKKSILLDILPQYEQYTENKQEQSLPFFARLKKWVTSHSRLVKTFELFMMFVISEFFTHLTDSAVIFSIVDFRTIFIVIMATLYGLPFGVAAATLSSISYFLRKVATGMAPLTMFYEPTNWLAFIFFFLVGGVCGYANLRKDDKMEALEQQNQLLEDKLIFTSEIYEDTRQEKRELKKQIISSKDSFGKIFDITRRLNTVEPQQLYLRIIETFEEILDNKSLTVYSIKPGTAFGRLEVASREYFDNAARSVSLEEYGPVIEQLKNGGIWRNTTLDRRYPMFAAGVYREDNLILMFFLWHANTDQQSLYYTNLFKIMRDLAQMSLLRAYDYGIAMLEKQYIPNTHIMNARYFEESLKHFDALAEKKVSSYLSITFDLNGHTLEEADKMLAGKIRTTDILGVTQEGELCLILAQATKQDLDSILPRFEDLGIIDIVCK